MQVSFGDGAFDAYVHAVAQLPAGYNMALLNEGQDVPESDWTPGVDVSFLSADHSGVTYRDVDESGEAVGPACVRTWDTIARVHVY